MSPRRLQLRRTPGYRLPDNAVVVARPTRWGNPFKTGHGHLTNEEVVDLYRTWLLHPERADLLAAARVFLRGHDLVCWCRPDQACHADVLLELANA